MRLPRTFKASDYQVDAAGIQLIPTPNNSFVGEKARLKTLDKFGGELIPGCAYCAHPFLYRNIDKPGGDGQWHCEACGHIWESRVDGPRPHYATTARFVREHQH